MNHTNKRLAVATAVALSFCILALASARAAVSENSWRNAVTDGEWAEAANWNTTTFYPMAVDTAAMFSAPSGSIGTNIAVRLPDESGKLDHLHVLMRANATYTFDGTGRTFALVEREADEPVRGTQDQTGMSFYPFAIMGESASSHQSVHIARNGSSGYRDAVLTWENARLRVSSPSLKHVVSEFIGGTFDFDPGRSRNWTLCFGSGTLAKSETAVSNATLRCSAFTPGFYSTNCVFTVGAGGVVECYGPMSVCFNIGSTYDWDATNEFVVADGGRVAFCNGGEKLTTEGFFMGSQNAMKRRSLAKFTGPGTLVDFRQAGTSYFHGNTAIDVADGATLVLSGRTGLGYANASAVQTEACEMTISGDETRILLATNLTEKGGNGFVYVGAANHSSNRVVMTGGKILPLYPAAPSGAGGVNIRVASANSNTRGLFEMRGGDIDLWVTNNPNPAVNCTLSIGPGNGEFHMSGGSLYCGDLYVGVNGGTKTTVQRLRMTGGKINCNRLYLGSSNSNSTFQYQDAHVDLDGGVLTCRQYAFVSSSALYDTGGYAHGYLTANGGTLRATSNSTLLQKFDTAEMGPKGLTIDNNGHSSTITQSFSDKPGEEGSLVFAGSGTAILKPDRYYSVSRTVVREGTLKFATNTVLATTLVITNGATVSLDGEAAKLTVDSLIVPKGTIYLNPGDAIHLTSDQIDLSGLTVRFTGTPASGSTYDFLEFDGDVTDSETVRDAMRWIAAYNSVSGNHAAFTLSYDAETGKTTATATYKPDAAALADETVWNGPAWDANGWSAGVPTAEKVASFSNASAPTAVSVPANAEVGAISVSSGGDYVFTGTGLEIPGGKEGSWLGVEAGSAEFDLPIGLRYSLPVTLASGTSATFNSPVAGGGLVKTGKGVLTLAADNHFFNAVSVGDGLNIVTSAGALDNAAKKATLTEDTLVFTNAVDGSEMVVSTPIEIKSATSKTNAVVIKADSDVRLADLTVTKGAFVKRGRGKLTIDASAEKNVTLSCDYGATASGSNYRIETSSTFTFANDGTAPAPETKQYAGFNVAEGEVVIKGEPDVSKTVNALTGCCIGMNVAGDAATFEQPVLTVDGVYLDTYAGGHTTIGIKKCGTSGCAVARPMLRVLNGGRFRAGNIRLGYSASNAGAYPTLVATNAKVHAVNAIRFEVGGPTSDRGCIVRAKDSTIAVTGTGGSHHGTYISGAVDADFDNCIVGGTAEIGKLQYQNASAGTLRFRNGSVLAAYPINTVASASYTVTLLFDDAEWSLGDGDVTIASTSGTGSYLLYKNKRVVNVENTGMILKPTSGHTYTFSFPITGTGGVVSAGEGTVAFTGSALQFSGLLDIRSGTVDLTAANARDALAVRGPGTLKGGNIATLTISGSLDDGTVVGAPVLDGVTADRVVVDFGRDESSPIDESEAENLLVATYPMENPPAVGRWKVSGTGLAHPRAEFTVSGGEVRATVKEAVGTMMIIR